MSAKTSVDTSDPGRQESRSGDWPLRVLRETALKDAEARLAENPDEPESRFDRARLLTELGRSEEAKHAYLEILQRWPAHFGALNNLGALLHSTGYKTAARSCYARAAALHPDNAMAHINLGNILCEEEDWVEARRHYEKALSLAPDHPQAHRGLAGALRALGDEAAAELHRQAGFQNCPVTVLPYTGQGQPITLLLLVSGTTGNISLRSVLDESLFHCTVIAPEFFDPAQPLPPHALVVNLIGDADLCRPALDAARRLAARTTAPVLNHPDAVLLTGRIANARRLAQIPDVIAPVAIERRRAELEAPEAIPDLERLGLTAPFLLRSPGFHNGRHFSRVERGADLPDVLQRLPGDAFIALQFLDARGADGKIRKYRVMIIDGELYPLHAAVSHDWKIHFATADMADFPEHRAEDKAFLDNMQAVLGDRAIGALNRIQETLALDYAGIDFGLDADGNVLLFEANATMVVPPPAPDEKWGYRRAAVENILAAARSMLVARSM